MSTKNVRVGDVLTLQRRQVDLDPTLEYEEIGLRSFGRGIFHKPPVAGSDLGNKRVFRIEPGDLVISNVFAWEGAVAVASAAEIGKIGSHRFMTFTACAEGTIDTRYAAWFFRSEMGLKLLKSASPGSAGRNRTLAVGRFEDLTLPLPPLEEQRPVVDRLERVDAIAAKALERTKHANLLNTALGTSLSSRPELSERGKRRRGWRRECLGSVMQPSIDRVEVKPSGSYPNVGIYSFGRGLFAKPPIEGNNSSAKKLNRIRGGQFIYSRLFAFEGAYAVVPQEFDGYYVSNEFPAFDVDPTRLDSSWLAAYLRSPDRWIELASKSKGLGVRRQRVSIESVLSYEVWLPPIEEQRVMVRGVRDVETIRMKRESTSRLIEALTPATVNAAFGIAD